MTVRADLVDRVAADVHAAWVEAKHAQGITSRLSSDGVEQMVPYDDLPDHIKELDRATVRAVLASPSLQVTLTALTVAESILALLHHRGLVDSPMNREDVAYALHMVQHAQGRREHPGRPPGTHGVEMQGPDGSWRRAEPLPYQGRVAKVEQWARARGWTRVADRLAAFDERSLGR